VESFNGRIRGRNLEICALLILTKVKVVGRAAPDRVQRMQTDLSSLGTFMPGSSSATESPNHPSALIGTEAAKGIASIALNYRAPRKINLALDRGSV